MLMPTPRENRMCPSACLKKGSSYQRFLFLGNVPTLQEMEHVPPGCHLILFVFMFGRDVVISTSCGSRLSEAEVRESADLWFALVSNIAEAVLQQPSGTM